MLLAIPDLLTAEQVLQARQLLDSAQWVDGRVTAGHQSSRAKDNLQLPEGHPVANQLGEMILETLDFLDGQIANNDDPSCIGPPENSTQGKLFD